MPPVLGMRGSGAELGEELRRIGAGDLLVRREIDDAAR
jgi:hypothetical protein